MKPLNLTSTVAALAAAFTLAQTSRAADAPAESWIDQAISPVANPLFFESPFIQSEVRPIFAYHNIDDTFVGGFVRYYALQVRYAVNDRLAIIATKDGYIELRPDAVVPAADGWADIGAGLKYAVIDDREANFILTPGLKFEFPAGQSRVLQGNGDGEFNVFVSAAKGWDRLHVSGTFGARVPVDFDEETASLHYALMVDYYTCQWFIPFVALNGFTWLSEGDTALTGNIEGFDLVNFGSNNVRGETQLTFAVGARSRLCKWADLGFAYERCFTTPKGLFDDRYTFDMIVRF